MCIDFEESSYTVCEGDGNPLLCLIVTGDLGRDVTVTFQTMDDSEPTATVRPSSNCNDLLTDVQFQHIH